MVAHIYGRRVDLTGDTRKHIAPTPTPTLTVADRRPQPQPQNLSLNLSLILGLPAECATLAKARGIPLLEASVASACSLSALSLLPHDLPPGDPAYLVPRPPPETVPRGRTVRNPLRVWATPATWGRR
jgi:hypothetical protein